MKVIYNQEKKENLLLALGFFDGIHKGHQKVIKSAVDFAKRNGIKSAVVSFVNHPACFILKRSPEYILSTQDKLEEISKLGIDYIYLLDFNKTLSNMTKEEYFEMLLKMTSPKSITTGFNHYFGKNKQGDTEFLSKICAQNNIKYQKIEPVKIDNNVVSSSLIRNFIINADFQTVKQMLGKDFYLKNEVIKGLQIGKKLGFKTINMDYPENIIKLPYGVYCTKTEINGGIYKSITNWGEKPTIKGINKPIVETHIFDFNRTIYGKIAKVIFLKKIREERKFDNLYDLQSQIKQDVEFCKSYFSL